MLDLMIQKILFLLLNIIIKRVCTYESNKRDPFLSGNNLFKFGNIKKRFWISKYGVRIHPSMILQLLISSQKGETTAYSRQFFVGNEFQRFCTFCNRIYMFTTEFLVIGKIKNTTFCTGMYTITTGKQAKRIQ